MRKRKQQNKPHVSFSKPMGDDWCVAWFLTGREIYDGEYHGEQPFISLGQGMTNSEALQDLINNLVKKGYLPKKRKLYLVHSQN